MKLVLNYKIIKNNLAMSFIYGNDQIILYILEEMYYFFHLLTIYGHLLLPFSPGRGTVDTPGMILAEFGEVSYLTDQYKTASI
jgi:hypothetical protein